MSYQYLLDTNILSDLIRYPQGRVFQRIATVGENSICTSIIVACELRFGVAKSGSSRLVQQLGCEYGNDDNPTYRERWLKRGAPWFDSKQRPLNWDLEEPLRHIIPDWNAR